MPEETKADHRESGTEIGYLELADKAKALLVYAKTEHFSIWQAENFIAKVEPVLRALAASTVEPVAWPKPISTAPTDGTVFIAHQNDDIYKCAWREEEPDEGPPRSGWYDFANKSFEDPTQWQPLEVAAPTTSPEPDAVREALARKLLNRRMSGYEPSQQARGVKAFLDNKPAMVKASYFRIVSEAFADADIAIAALSRPAHGERQDASLTIERTAATEPSPSHGGPVRWIYWKLLLNGAVVKEFSERIPWNKSVDGLGDPFELVTLRDAINAGLTRRAQS